LPHNLIQLHIIARLFNKINPFFEKMQDFSKKYGTGNADFGVCDLSSFIFERKNRRL